MSNELINCCIFHPLTSQWTGFNIYGLVFDSARNSQSIR